MGRGPPPRIAGSAGSVVTPLRVSGHQSNVVGKNELVIVDAIDVIYRMA